MIDINNIDPKVAEELSVEIGKCLDDLIGDGEKGQVTQLFNNDNTINREQLKKEIDLCEKWLKSFDNIITAIKNNNILKELEDKKEDRQQGAFKRLYQQNLIQQYGQLLKEGYTLLQYLRVSIQGNNSVTKYRILVECSYDKEKGSTYEEVEVDLRKLLEKVSFNFSAPINGIKNLYDFIGGSSLKIYKNSFKNDLKEKSTKEKKEDNFKAEAMTKIGKIFKSKTNLNEGFIYEAFQQALQNKKDLKNFLSIIEELESIDDNFMNSVFIRRKKQKKNRITGIYRYSKKNDDLFQKLVIKFKFNNEEVTFEDLFNKIITAYVPEQDPSYAHGGDIGNYELKNVANSPASLISAHTVFNAIKRALDTLKDFRDSDVIKKETIKQFKNGSKILQGRKKDTGWIYNTLNKGVKAIYKEVLPHIDN